MRRARSLAPACALALTAMAAFIVQANATPKDSTLDAQIDHGVSGCEGASPGKTAFGFIPPGFDYRFTVTSAADAHPMMEAHRKFAGYWEKTFRRPVVSWTEVGDLKRELRLTGSRAAAWLLGSESQIDEFLSACKPGIPVTYEVALLGCTGSAGSFDAIMALKEFEVETD
jgi:hypothetical protein